MVSTDRPVAIRQITKLNIPTVNKTGYAKSVNNQVSKKVVVPYDLKSLVVAGNPVSSLVSNPSAVTKQLTTAQQDAINQAYNRKMGIAILQSASFQKVSSIVKAKTILAGIDKSGMEINPKGTGTLIYTAQEQANTMRDALNVLSAQQQEWGAKQTDYLSRISQNESLLATATNRMGILSGQLETTQSKYLELQKKYNELLENPPSEGIDIMSFINKYGLWIALGVGAIILLPSITNIFKRGE